MNHNVPKATDEELIAMSPTTRPLYDDMLETQRMDGKRVRCAYCSASFRYMHTELCKNNRYACNVCMLKE